MPVIRRLSPIDNWFKEPTSPFSRGANARPLRAVIDRDSISSAAALEVIDGLRGLDELELWSTVDDGGPWVEFGPVDEDWDVAPVTWHGKDSTSLEAVLGAAGYRVLAGQPVTGTTEAAFRDLVLVEAVRSHRCDLLVTDSPFLLADPPANVRSTEDATGIVGLFLRSRGLFRVNADLDLSGLWFYLILTRLRLPAAWRWFSACADSTHQGPPTLAELGQVAIERVNWSLRARDRLLWSEAADETAFYLDAMLLQLSGAFDATAEVAAAGLGVGGKPGWRKQTWMKDLSTSFPSLAALMAGGTEHRDALEIISLPRNTIHGAGLPRLGLSQGNTPSTNVVRVPPNKAGRQLAAAIRRRGGDTVWGLGTLSSGELVLDPGVYVEQALPRAIAALDALMGAMQPERFPGVNPATLETGPPPPRHLLDAFAPRVTAAVTALAGLG